MMMGAHMMSVMLSASMTQWLCTAGLFMHDKPDSWVEYNGRALL